MINATASDQRRSLKLLFVSTPVGALGTGLGGGVELTLRNIALEMQQRGHQVTVVAMQGSVLESVELIQIEGEIPINAQTQNRTDPIIISTNSLLANFWNYVGTVQSKYELIVNFSYDWLPFYLTSFLNKPVAHLVSMGSLSEAMDQIIEKVAIQFPGTIGVHTLAQAETFRFSDRCRILKNGIDLSLYNFVEQPTSNLAWVGRIAPEKGLEDAIAVSHFTGIPLKVMGLMQHQDYWQKITQDYPNAPVEYVGFLSTIELQEQLGKCQALLVTPRWVEAFGNVAIEALACGVPVIAYSRGGLIEIVKDGKTGFLVQPDSVEGLIMAIKRLPEINRYDCRASVEEYSLKAMGDRVESWFRDILARS